MRSTTKNRDNTLLIEKLSRLDPDGTIDSIDTLGQLPPGEANKIIKEYKKATNRFQMRDCIERDDKIENIANSIHNEGQKTPVLITILPNGEVYTLTGFTRVDALLHLNKKFPNLYPNINGLRIKVFRFSNNFQQPKDFMEKMLLIAHEAQEVDYVQQNEMTPKDAAEQVVRVFEEYYELNTQIRSESQAKQQDIAWDYYVQNMRSTLERSSQIKKIDNAVKKRLKRWIGQQIANKALNKPTSNINRASIAARNTAPLPPVIQKPTQSIKPPSSITLSTNFNGILSAYEWDQAFSKKMQASLQNIKNSPRPMGGRRGSFGKEAEPWRQKRIVDFLKCYHADAIDPNPSKQYHPDKVTTIQIPTGHLQNFNTGLMKILLDKDFDETCGKIPAGHRHVAIAYFNTPAETKDQEVISLDHNEFETEIRRVCREMESRYECTNSVVQKFPFFWTLYFKGCLTKPSQIWSYNFTTKKYEQLV